MQTHGSWAIIPKPSLFQHKDTSLVIMSYLSNSQGIILESIWPSQN